MRISNGAALLLLPLLAGLAACNRQPERGSDAAAVPVVVDEDRIGCAHGSAPLTRACTVDRLAGDGGLMLTVRHPDGAFHRLLVTRDGRGVVAGDGAERPVVTVASPDMIDVAIGGDRYRLPATVKAAR